MDKTRGRREHSGAAQRRPNSGIHPSFTWSRLQAGRTRGNHTNNPHKPYTTLELQSSNSDQILQQIGSKRSGRLPITGWKCKWNTL